MRQGRDRTLQAPLWRALAAYRVAALAYAVIVGVHGLSDYARPVLAWPVLAVMTGWTVLTGYAYANPARRRPPLLVADLLVTMAAMVSSDVVIGRSQLEHGPPTLTVAWHAAPVLAWTLAGGRWAGIPAALAMGGANMFLRDHYDQGAFTGLVLMVLAALAVGYFVHLAEVAQRRLRRAIELEAASRERDRLARDIHDSVLQVLALVKRRGAGLPGEAGELARLAGEQEAALRNLVSGHAAETSDDHPELDLMALLSPYASPVVTLSGPAGPVRLPAAAARELAGAVAAALDNVTRHCEPGTKVYLLVEDEPGEVVVTVRDDGCGIEPDRLEQAAAQGRLGVAKSIRGRVADLHGTVRIDSAPGAGTEVEMTVPRSRVTS